MDDHNEPLAVVLYLLNVVWMSAYKTTRLHKISTEILWKSV